MPGSTLLYAPRYIDFGGGAAARLPALLERFNLRHPLIVTDPFMVKSGLIDRILKPLNAAGIAFQVFADTVPDPTDSVVEAGLARLADGLFDSIVGFGGGSPIDTAKAMNILAWARRSDPESKLRGLKMPASADQAAFPLIAIPTTAGTGSEVTRFTVVTDTEKSEKMLISGLGALPTAAIVDHTLTFSVPARTTADTGLDSLTHALEAFVSRRADANSDLFARSALALIGKHLRAAFLNPQDETAREAMMLGATHAGFACSIAPVALVHGMARPIGAHFHVPHGLSNAMMLPTVTAFSLQHALRRYADAARLAGFAEWADGDEIAGQKLVRGLAELNLALRVPTPQAYGIDQAVWTNLLPVMAQQAIASGSPALNPRVPTAAEIERLYEVAFS